LYNGIAGEAIHAESGICVHAGGQLPCGGRFGAGAGAAKVVTPGGRPTGGAGLRLMVPSRGSFAPTEATNAIAIS
jgi:hypothetical protein